MRKKFLVAGRVDRGSAAALARAVGTDLCAACGPSVPTALEPDRPEAVRMNH